MKISFSLIQKNKKYRKHASWYIRKRCEGKSWDIHLHTTDAKVAEAELLRVRLAQAELDRQGIDGDALTALAVNQAKDKEQLAAPNGTLEKWCQQLHIEGFRDLSISKYYRAVKRLLRGESAIGLTPSKVTTIIASTANLKSNTRHGYVNALNSFFKYLGRHDLIECLPKIKIEQAERPYWTPSEMFDIVSSVKSDTAERTLEYMDYFGIMAAIGSRQSETYALRWRDLDKDTGIVTFRAETTKSRKERRCPLPYNLWAQIEVRRKDDTDLDSPLFPSIGRDQATRYAVLARAVKKLGLKGGLHTFRHSVAMHLYKKSGDIKAVSQLLGHSPQVALQYYQHSRGVEDLRKLVEDDMDDWMRDNVDKTQR